LHRLPTLDVRGRLAGDGYGASASPSWRDVGWERHAHTVELAGNRVSYIDLGAAPGPPLVFIHGIAGCWQHWLENLPAIAQDRRVIALDLPGFGASPLPSRPITIPAYACVVDALCERLDLGSVVLVGNSMGGFVAAQTAIDFPMRVERLALVSPAGITSANVKRAPGLAFARVMHAMQAERLARVRRLTRRPRGRHLVLSIAVRHPALLKLDLVENSLLRGAGKPGFWPAALACLAHDFRDRLTEIQCPTLVVWGREDSILPVLDAEEFARLIPETRVVIIDHTGHAPMLERPAVFNDLLRRFIA
jgi:pimeloyl-ACP methyl ester carboxylesterase